MSLRFIHFSDTHLGFSDLDLADKDGNNIRENDVYKSFSNIIDIIIERKPDFVVHAGDIFHRSSPTNKALIVAAQQLSRLSQANIPFYMVAGNHDYPKSSFTTPIHDLYSSVIKGKVFYSEEYEQFEQDRYIIHALPHINNENVFENEALKIGITNRRKINILVSHLSILNFRNEEFGERVLPDKALDKLKDFDYVALGHIHKYNHIKKYGNVFYSGSTERFSSSEFGYEKGIIEVTIDKETSSEFIPIATRNGYSIKIENCSNKKKDEILGEIKAVSKDMKLENSIVNISFTGLTQTQFYEITKEDLDKLFNKTLYYSYTKTVIGKTEEIVYDSESFDLREQLNTELTKNFTDPQELNEVSKLTSEILAEIEEEEINADN